MTWVYVEGRLNLNTRQSKIFRFRYGGIDGAFSGIVIQGCPQSRLRANQMLRPHAVRAPTRGEVRPGVRFESAASPLRTDRAAAPGTRRPPSGRTSRRTNRPMHQRMR